MRVPHVVLLLLFPTLMRLAIVIPLFFLLKSFFYVFISFFCIAYLFLIIYSLPFYFLFLLWYYSFKFSSDFFDQYWWWKIRTNVVEYARTACLGWQSRLDRVRRTSIQFAKIPHLRGSLSLALKQWRFKLEILTSNQDTREFFSFASHKIVLCIALYTCF